MKKQLKKPQYKNLQFDSKKEFENWLKNTTHCIIKLEDCGQDLLKMWVAESGEILHCNLQGHLWNGKFINMETLNDFVPFQLWFPFTREWSRFIVPVSKVTYTNESTTKRQPSHA